MKKEKRYLLDSEGKITAFGYLNKGIECDGSEPFYDDSIDIQHWRNVSGAWERDEG